MVSQPKDYCVLNEQTDIDNARIRLNVLSIDAWNDGDGCWTWNSWYKVGSAPLEAMHWKPRRVLKYLREDLGLLPGASKGKLAVEDDQFNLVIVEKRSGRPLYAIEYGQHV